MEGLEGLKFSIFQHRKEISSQPVDIGLSDEQKNVFFYVNALCRTITLSMRDEDLVSIE